MADERKKKLTQTMDAYTGGDAPNAPPSGGRSKGDDEHRGLAAFERGQPAAPDRGGKGSSRWSGGGASSGPPPKKPESAKGSARDDVDEDLRAARLEAREVDDDGMVNVSGSLWGEEMAPGRGGKRRGRAEVEEEVEEEEEAPKKKSSAWKWIVATLLLGGAGVGGAIGASQMDQGGAAATGADAQNADKTADKAATKVATKDEPAEDEDKVKADDKASADEDAGSAPADDAAAAEEPADAGEAAEVVAAVEPPKAPSGPATWAPTVEATNPWVALPAAPAGKMLGLTAAEAHDDLGKSRTGLWPAAKLAAPAQPFQMATHEVTWSELEKAATLPDVATLTRPKWVPKDAKRRASLPATGVPWQLAEAFCEGLGGTLPSEAEYEWAARGADDRYFPWGREAVDTNDVHIVAGRPVPVIAVGTSKLDKTPEPTVFYDLLGNAQEWTRDAWRPSDPDAAADPRATTHKAIRGWPLSDPPRIPAEGSTYRAAGCADAACMASDGAALERIGFRCVKSGG